MRTNKTLLLFIICAICFSLRAMAYDAERSHPDLTNETLDQYVRLYGTSTLSNGVSLTRKLSGEVITKTGQRIVLTVSVRDWIIIGSAEEDWGGLRASAHYYDPSAATKGIAAYAAGAVEWIHDRSSQALHYVPADGIQDPTGDYTYERFRYFYFNNPQDYRTYKMLGHLLHVLQDMAGPPHVRGDSGGGRRTYEGLVAGLMGTSMLTDILAGKQNISRAGYLETNADSLGINSITVSDLPSKTRIDDYFTELAAQVNSSYFSPNTIYGSLYSAPSAPTIPPVNPPYTATVYTLPDGKKSVGFSNTAGQFVFSRSILSTTSAGWSGYVTYSSGAAIDAYKKLSLLSVKYGLGFIATATKSNTLPKVAIQNFVGVQSGNVEIRYNLKDMDYDRVDIKVYYSEDGGATYNLATVGPGSDSTSAIAATPEWVQYTVYWNSDSDIGSTDQNDIRIKIIPSDSGDGFGQETDNFTLQNFNRPPTAIVSTPAGKIVRYVTINYTLSDIDSSVSGIAVYYSLDGGQTFLQASEYSVGSEGTSSLATSPAGEAHVFVWDSLQDLGASDVADVRIKIVPSDATGTGKAGVSDAFSVSNGAPYVEVADLAGEQKDQIAVTYKLYDAGASLCSISFQYSSDGGATYHDGTMGSGGDGIANLTSSVDGVSHTFVWDSPLDIGFARQSDVKVKITPTNATASGAGAEGNSFVVENRVIVVFVSPVAGESVSDNVYISYTLTGPASAANNLTFEFSVNGKISYNSCTAGTLGNVNTSLTSSAAGVQYTFVWDSRTDFAALNAGNGWYSKENVVIKATTSQGGASVESSAFTVENANKLAESPWPKEYGPDIANRCRSPYYGPDYSGNVSVQRWISPIGLLQYHSSPVIGSDGMIYAVGYTAADGHGLYALYPEDGSKKWFLANPVFAAWTYTSPALSADGTLYVCFTNAGNDGELYAVNSSDGSLKWSSSRAIGVHNGYCASPNIDPLDGTIYLSGRDAAASRGKCYAVKDNGSGSAPTDKWGPYDSGYNTDPYGAPAIDPDNGNDAVIFTPGYTNLRVASLRRSTGTAHWTVNASSSVYASMVVHDGYAYYARQSYLTKHETTGSEAWTTGSSFGDIRGVSVAVGYNGVLYIANNDNKLYAYTTGMGQQWEHTMLGQVDYPAPIVDAGGVIYHVGGQFLQAIEDNGASSSDKWDTDVSWDMSGYLISLAMGSDSNIYVAGRENNAYYLRCYGPSAPVVQKSLPSSGWKNIETKIKIIGGNFKTAGGQATSVKLKAGATEIALVFTYVDYATILATVPTGLTAGVYDIIVTTPDASNAASYGKYTVVE